MKYINRLLKKEKSIDNPTIIIILDYEIWGTGAGDILKFLIEPTDRLIRILNERKIKMTVFFEIEEYLVFKKYAKNLINKFGYNPA